MICGPRLDGEARCSALFFGTLLGVLGIITYFLGVVFSIFRLMLHLGEPFRTWNAAIVWYSAVPSTFGLLLAAADLAFLLPGSANDRSGSDRGQ